MFGFPHMQQNMGRGKHMYKEICARFAYGALQLLHSRAKYSPTQNNDLERKTGDVEAKGTHSRHVISKASLNRKHRGAGISEAHPRSLACSARQRKVFTVFAKA